MLIDTQAKSKSLLGVTDLTLIAPIRRGLIPALDARSYESRLRLVLKTLNTLRVSSLEVDSTTLIGDAVERIRAIHSFRLALVGPEPKQLLLSVGFDGGWEPYIRRIWRDLGPLLDVMLCNCEGYLISREHSFAEYTAWIRSVQVGTEFFYHASSLTINDLYYLRKKENERIEGLGAQGQPKPAPPSPHPWSKKGFEQALPGLVGVYRLSDMYPPSEPSDGKCLGRAAHHLFPALSQWRASGAPFPVGQTATECAALGWFSRKEWSGNGGAKKAAITAPHLDLSKIQGGIVAPHDRLTHGCMVLVELRDAAAAEALLAYLNPASMSAQAQASQSDAQPFINLAFTLQGLKVAGVPAGTLEQLPSEFREGMAARASILGDALHNHPIHWALPERNWPRSPTQGTADRVELSAVHAVVQYAVRDKASMDWADLDASPVLQFVEALDHATRPPGVRILSVQPLQRFVKQATDLSREHFGFQDGFSQPSLAPPFGATYSDRVPLGDILLGYDNALGDPPLKGRLWDDSTFLVVRKLRQDVEALNEALEGEPCTPSADGKMAQLMGRAVNGVALGQSSSSNDFDYAGDAEGTLCPFQSHVRRANPRIARDDRHDLRTIPRIVRRGMSYGPRYSEAPEQQRGLVFMAYNASIAEQFEVIQAWLAGGNSAAQDSYSALRDPFLGVPTADDPRRFAFTAKGGRGTLNLASERPFTRLEWGLYLFVPSIRALRELQDLAHEAALLDAAGDEGEKKKRADQRELRLAREAQLGAAVIAKLQASEQVLGFEGAKAQWKIALEDVSSRMSGTSAAIWTAIRRLHGGVLRTPYGVLVCTRDLVLQVFENSGRVYSASGYAARMRESFGEIYLGMDEPAHAKQCKLPNQAIMDVSRRDAFDLSYGETVGVLGALMSGHDEITVEVKDIVDGVLAGLCNKWFGIPDKQNVIAGGWHWMPDDQPTCPGHFGAPSRYMFQPNPGPEAEATGKAHGKALEKAVGKFVAQHRPMHLPAMPRPPHTVPNALLAKALFIAIPYREEEDPDNVKLTRTLIGVMMGFLPTVDGNLRGAMFEWVNDRSLWDHQIAYLATRDRKWLRRLAEADSVYVAARYALKVPLRRTLQLRPVPELAWRTARESTTLGKVALSPGDTIVASIVSATQQALAEDDSDLYMLFGGKRTQADQTNHACPGYRMAIGVMLGFLAGLMQTVRMRPTLSPMALRISRRAPAAAPTSSADAALAPSATAYPTPRTP